MAGLSNGIHQINLITLNLKNVHGLCLLHLWPQRLQSELAVLVVPIQFAFMYLQHEAKSSLIPFPPDVAALQDDTVTVVSVDLGVHVQGNSELGGQVLS